MTMNMRRIVMLVICVIMAIPFLSSCDSFAGRNQGEDIIKSSPSNTSTPSEISIEGLKIPPLSVAQRLTEKISNVPGSSGFVIPMNYDLQLAVEKGLCGEEGFGEKYLYIQALYRKVFESWFLEATSLRDFDDQMASSELGLLPVPEHRQTFYQYYSTMDLQFVYLCSNIPIERLDNTDLAMLQSAIEKGEVDATLELIDMVQRTFSDVLMAFPNLEDDVLCGYGYGGDISPNRSIVLEVRNWYFDDDGNFRDAENNVKMDDYMRSLAEEMQQTLSEEIGHRVVVMVET